MADYFVAASGSNTSPYDTWANAATSLQTALTAAATNGDRVIIQYDGVPSGDSAVATNTTWTFAASIALIASTNSGTATITPTPMGTGNWLGHSTISWAITFAGAYKVFVYGITLRNAASTPRILILANDDLSHFYYENCYFWWGSSGSGASIQVGGQDRQAAANLKNCTLRFGSTSARINTVGRLVMENCVVSSDGSAPATLFYIGSILDPGGSTVYAEGCDFSHLGSGTLFATPTTSTGTATLVNCKMGSGFVVNTSGEVNLSQQETYLFNCSSGDNHYNLQHHNAFGSTIVDTGIYANDGAQYDGTNRCSWKIASTANCSYYTPYVSPWIDCYHGGTAAITPYLEILRDGSATAYQDDEVWVEFSYQGTTGFPLSVIVNDRMTLAGSPANQAAGVGTSGWTGDTGAWSGKLQSPSITPAEIGHLRARVCVGEPSITVYVDPQIRGRS